MLIAAYSMHRACIEIMNCCTPSNQYARFYFVFLLYRSYTSFMVFESYETLWYFASEMHTSFSFCHRFLISHRIWLIENRPFCKKVYFSILLICGNCYTFSYRNTSDTGPYSASHARIVVVMTTKTDVIQIKLISG